MLKKLKILINDIDKISKKEKKSRAFIISNTADKNAKKYLTPLRISPSCVYGGAVVYDDETTKEICQLIEKKIDFIFVDTEKKASIDRKKGAINIERTVRENIQLNKIFYFKANDLTVNSASNFMEMLFQKDIRNVSNKKVLIIGAGNIGFKLSLNLIERGVKIYLNGKDKLNTLKLISAINKIKPSATLNKVKYFNTINKDLSDFDVIVNASNSVGKILKNYKIPLKKNVIFLEIGKNLFSGNVLKKYLEHNLNIFRLDVSNSFNELIEQKINTKGQWRKTKFERVRRNKFYLISPGLLGKTGDIVADNPSKPKFIYGKITRKGNLKDLTNSEKRKIFNYD